MNLCMIFDDFIKYTFWKHFIGGTLGISVNTQIQRPFSGNSTYIFVSLEWSEISWTSSENQPARKWDCYYNHFICNRYGVRLTAWVLKDNCTGKGWPACVNIAIRDFGTHCYSSHYRSIPAYNARVDRQIHRMLYIRNRCTFHHTELNKSKHSG